MCGPRIEQRFEQVFLQVRNGVELRRFVAAISRIGVGSRAKQPHANHGVPVLGRREQRRRSPNIGVVGVRSRFEEQFHDVERVADAVTREVNRASYMRDVTL